MSAYNVEIISNHCMWWVGMVIFWLSCLFVISLSIYCIYICCKDKLWGCIVVASLVLMSAVGLAISIPLITRDNLGYDVRMDLVIPETEKVNACDLITTFTIIGSYSDPILDCRLYTVKLNNRFHTRDEAEAFARWCKEGNDPLEYSFAEGKG